MRQQSSRPQIEEWFYLLGISLPMECKKRGQATSQHQLDEWTKELKDMAKKSFHEKAKIMHPDKNPKDAGSFKYISQAYHEIQKHFILVMPQPRVQKVRIVRHGPIYASTWFTNTNTGTTTGFTVNFNF